MQRHILDHVNLRLERWLPEQRFFMRSEDTTRFVRLRPLTQLAALTASASLLGWAVVASAILFVNGISSSSAGDQADVSQSAFEQRLIALAQERDSRTREAQQAQDRFRMALEQVSAMQSQLLASDERLREAEKGIDAIQTTLRHTINERDTARKALVQAQGLGASSAQAIELKSEDMADQVDLLTAALSTAASDRDAARDAADQAREDADQALLDKRLIEQRNDQIFTTLEGAVKVSMEPLNTMFRKVGLNPNAILAQIRKGYSGIGGPLMPARDKGASLSPDAIRAQGILDQLDEMNMYRIAVEDLPFKVPLNGGYRFTSPFGYRWGRLHAGVDLAGPIGMDVHAPADGTVVAAGPESGYGNMIKLRHDFGISTVYGHLSKIRVRVGQKVSRGDVIGDSGNSGRSTGPHLHYEIRVDDTPVNPMTFIKAANDVF